MEKGDTAKKVFGIIGNVIIWIVAIFALFAVCETLASKKSNDGAASIFGYQLRFVETGSMEKSEFTDVSGYKIKSIPTRSCVFVQVVPKDETKKAEWYAGLKVGDVLTFRYTYTAQITVTHRIVGIDAVESGGYRISLQGDNKSSPDAAGTQVIYTDDSSGTNFNYVIGKVTGQSYFLGLAVYALKTPVGIVCIVILPCLIIIALRVIQIVGVLNADREEKQRAENESRKNEIEELKRRLEQLKASNAGSEDPSGEDKI